MSKNVMASFKIPSVMFLRNMAISLAHPPQAPTPIISLKWTNHLLSTYSMPHPVLGARTLNKNIH